MERKLAVEVKGLEKTFKIPTEKRNTLIEYLRNPLDATRTKKFRALKNINLKVNEGENLAILGNNGSGKSTLLKVLAGIYQPDKGTVSIHGVLVPFLELGVGFHPELTAYENIFLNGIILGMTKEFIKKKFDEIVDFAEIREFLNLPLKNFSSGMQVRLAFSIAFMSSADIYVLDEVFAVGDIHFQQKCRAVFAKLKAEGKTFIFVSHAPDLVESFCDRAILIEDGEIIKEGKPKEVLAYYSRS
ncbi:ABC transporter ATP-binding protein [bacterium]|nr:ABC transporter ATP-binding protein [bacterium]